jgi:hypothetical protein
MPPKKHKKTSERHPITLRFDDNEMAALQTDRREINNTGIPVSAGAYAKHAVLSYPRLRKLEAQIRRDAEETDRPPDSEGRYARTLLENAR